MPSIVTDTFILSICLENIFNIVHLLFILVDYLENRIKTVFNDFESKKNQFISLGPYISKK